jgi:CheY-like chemotaxis protein
MRKRTILLADDDEQIRKLVGVTLGSETFTILHAGDGEESLETARAEKPDLILLDINMPRMSGLEVCRRIKSDPATADVKVVMLTASGSEEDRANAFAASADEYIVKPFSPIALLDLVYRLLGELPAPGSPRWTRSPPSSRRRRSHWRSAGTSPS